MSIIKNIYDKIEHIKCVGCKACGDACVKNAIVFEMDKEGFDYPIVDKKKCVECGECIKVCPIQEQLSPRIKSAKCYSAWSKQGKVRDASTSGGFFYELSKLVIEDHGVVIGARYSDDYKSVMHSVAHNMYELKGLMGSKYVQSDTKGIYSQIYNLLNDGYKVLFAGTPCQCAAVKKYLDGKVCLDKLYMMDFVCYSIYSPLVYRKWLEELEEQAKSRISRLRFKSKKYGWENRYLEIEFENGEKKYQSDLKGEDLFIAGIEDSDLYQRNSCYNCLFREETHRASDFTVGDFWGIQSQTEYDLFKGISFVLTNTSKADELLKKLNSTMVIRKCELEDIKKENPNMINNPVCNEEKRRLFFTYLLSGMKFSDSLYKSTGYKTPKIKKNIKKLKSIIFNRNISTMRYFYYNYLCKNVIRKGTSSIIPYKNAIIVFDKNSKLILEGYRDFNIGINKLPKSKAETYLRLYRDSNMTLFHGADMYYGSTIELMENAEFDAGYFSMNTGSVIVVDYRMSFGEYVGFGRNNMVYDSDFHALHTSRGGIINRPRKVIIGNHVWVTSNNNILPGSHIGDNVVVGCQNSINFNVPDNSFVRNNKVLLFSGWWSELSNMKQETLAFGKKIIIVGFGMEGKRFYSKYKDEVIAVIDNYSKCKEVVTFREFVKYKKKLNEDEVFVICSTKYFNELYNMIRTRYLDCLVLSGQDFYR